MLPSPDMLSSLLRGQKPALQSCLNGCVILGKAPPFPHKVKAMDKMTLRVPSGLETILRASSPTPHDCNKSVASIINSNNVRLFAHAPRGLLPHIQRRMRRCHNPKQLLKIVHDTCYKLVTFRQPSAITEHQPHPIALLLNAEQLTSDVSSRYQGRVGWDAA